MFDKQTPAIRRKAIKKTVCTGVLSTAWGAPVVQSILLPVHAQTSHICLAQDIPGTWQLEVLGPAASSSEIIFFSDDSVDHSIVNAWQFTNDEFWMTRGSTWIFTGSFGTCESLSGT